MTGWDGTFHVIDNKTGIEPDLRDIALHEDWAKSLIYCDMEGFAVEEDGTLLLLDETDRYVPCPLGRFTVIYHILLEKADGRG